MLSLLFRRLFSFSLPRDYVRRRRAIRKITTVLLVVLLSAAASYAIVHYSGPGAFAPPHP